MKYLRQICVAVAILLILYGAMQLIDRLSSLVNIYVSWYLWIVFQIIAAILIIFIGLRLYSLGKTIMAANFTQRRSEARPYVFALLLGGLALLPVTLLPLPSSNGLYAGPLQLHVLHKPISFSYRLHYRWNHQTGGSILISTTRRYSHGGIQILLDIIPVGELKLVGWVVIPYEIYDSPGAHPCVISPAVGSIELGNLENGVYSLRILMRGATDVFAVHKLHNAFSLEEVRVSKGTVAPKSEFEKRLDGFRVRSFGASNISSEVENFVLDRLRGIGGVIDAAQSQFEGESVDVSFYYGGDLADLRQIIAEIANDQPKYSIRIDSNIGWLAQSSQYNFLVVARPEKADSIRALILQNGLMIYDQERAQFYHWDDSIKFYCSSAPLNVVWAELRNELLDSISQKLGLQCGQDFWISYGC